ncbi:MAG: transcriptional regulator [Alphaproteobacteria bacterium]|nr:transcriptional regulator [Alphaproteobacteria bacterium]
MKWQRLKRERCSIARSLSVIGDRWTLLVLRECFLGVRRFEEFEAGLGISRTMLARRLQHLVKHGVLRRAVYSTRPRRAEYRLTEKGRALYPVLLSLLRFGDQELAGAEGPPLVLTHRPCGHAFHAEARCSACGEEVRPHDVSVAAGAP